MGDYLYYYVTQALYDEISKTKLIHAPVFLSTSPKLRSTDFKVQFDLTPNLAAIEPKEWVLGFHKKVMEQYSGRYTAQGDEVVIRENVPLGEASGIARITYMFNGLLYYNWVYRKSKE